MKYSWFYFNMYMIMVAMHCEVGLINLPVDLNIAVIYVYIAFLFDVYLCFQRMHATYACVFARMCMYIHICIYTYISVLRYYIYILCEFVFYSLYIRNNNSLIICGSQRLKSTIRADKIIH